MKLIHHKILTKDYPQLMFKTNTSSNPLQKITPLVILSLSLSILLFLPKIILTQDNLKINFIPSSKYKLNRKDLAILKEDLERQVSQRVFEIQAGWDERERLRHSAISRPPIIPPYPIPSPPVNIPINGNALAANLNFDNPSYDGNLFDEHRIDDNLENKISDYIEKKLQKDLTSQIAMTRQAITSLRREIDHLKPARMNHLSNNLDNPLLERDGTIAKPVAVKFLQKELITKDKKFGGNAKTNARIKGMIEYAGNHSGVENISIGNGNSGEELKSKTMTKLGVNNLEQKLKAMNEHNVDAVTDKKVDILEKSKFNSKAKKMEVINHKIKNESAQIKNYHLYDKISTGNQLNEFDQVKIKLLNHIPNLNNKNEDNIMIEDNKSNIRSLSNKNITKIETDNADDTSLSQADDLIENLEKKFLSKSLITENKENSSNLLNNRNSSGIKIKDKSEGIKQNFNTTRFKEKQNFDFDSYIAEMSTDQTQQSVQSQQASENNTSKAQDPHDVDISSLHIPENSLRYRILQDFYVKHKHKVPSVVDSPSQLNYQVKNYHGKEYNISSSLQVPRAENHISSNLQDSHKILNDSQSTIDNTSSSLKSGNQSENSLGTQIDLSVNGAINGPISVEDVTSDFIV